MKFSFLTLFICIATCLTAQQVVGSRLTTTSPLATFSADWNKPEYSKCNTAAEVKYMNDKEKELIYILNLARSSPVLFANTVVTKYPASSGEDTLINNIVYYQSLLRKLQSLDPLPLLYVDVKCYTSAECHASASGKTGYTGHLRNTDDCKASCYFSGECCYYGNDDPLNIVLSLLIDDGVPSLGHRQILLGNFTQIGVSIKEHSQYGHNAVLDLQF